MEYPVYPEYKNIDSEWLDGIPIKWNAKRLRFVVKINPVKSEVANRDKDDIVSFVPMEAVAEYGGIKLETDKLFSDVYSGYTYFRDGDVVVAKITPCFENGKGSIAEGLTNGIAFGTTEFHVLRSGKESNIRFIFYLSMSQLFRKIGESEMLGAGGQKRISEEYIRNFRIGIPSRQEQQKIADFLDYKTQQIDQLIEKKKALIEKLNEQRIVVITQAVTKGIDKNAKMKPSGVDWLGDVPEHWEVRQLKFVASYNDESLPETTDPDKEIRYVEISSVNNVDGIVEIYLTTFEKAPSRARRIVRDGDTIISTVRTYLKAIATVTNPTGNMIVSTGFAVIRSTKIINAAFLSFFLSSQKFVETVVANSKGVSYPAINASELVCIHIAFPEDKLEQKRIVGYVEDTVYRIDEMTDLNIKTIERLKEYRSSVITAAVTGKIDVRNIELPSTEAL